jgi:hypothetical protein
MIAKLRSLLNGKKTYLGMIAAGVLGILFASGLVDEKTAGIAASVITAWTGVSMRAAVEKSGDKRQGAR